MEPNASEDTKGVSWAMEDDGNETKNSSGSAAAMEDASLSADPLALLSSLSPEEFIATVFPPATVKDFDDAVPEEERLFCLQRYSDLSTIKQARMHCTSCNKHLGLSAHNYTRLRMHPLLRTLMCTECLKFYSSGEFSKGEDGSELYCRWCGQGGQVYCCSSCPIVFCAKCIRRNFGADKIEEIESNDDWNCFACSPKVLWCHRAALWAARRYCDLKNKFTLTITDSVKRLRMQRECQIDESVCCKRKLKPKVVIESKKIITTKKDESLKRRSSPIQTKKTSVHPIPIMSDSINMDAVPPPFKKIFTQYSPMNTPISNSIPALKNPIAITTMPSVSTPNIPVHIISKGILKKPSQQRKIHKPYNGFVPYPPYMEESFKNHFRNDNVNLSLDNLTAGLDMSKIPGMPEDNVVCTPDFPLPIEPLCEVTEDDDCTEVISQNVSIPILENDDIQCLTPQLPKQLSKLLKLPKLTPKPLSALLSQQAPPLLLKSPKPVEIVKMDERDVTVNSVTGALKFKVNPSSLSSSKMYQLPDGRVFSVNSNSNMAGGFSATIVSPSTNKQIPIQPAVPSTYKRVVARRGRGRRQNVTLRNVKETLKTYESPTRITRGMKNSTKNSSNITSSDSPSNSTTQSVEWYSYNLYDAVDLVNYVSKKIHKIKDTPIGNIRTKSIQEVKDLHYSLDQALKISCQRFVEIRNNLNTEFKHWLKEKCSGEELSDCENLKITSFGKSKNAYNSDEPIFIDENSNDSNAEKDDVIHIDCIVSDVTTENDVIHNTENNIRNTENDIRNTENDINNTENDINNTENNINNTENDTNNTENDVIMNDTENDVTNYTKNDVIMNDTENDVTNTTENDVIMNNTENEFINNTENELINSTENEEESNESNKDNEKNKDTNIGLESTLDMNLLMNSVINESVDGKNNTNEKSDDINIRDGCEKNNVDDCNESEALSNNLIQSEKPNDTSDNIVESNEKDLVGFESNCGEKNDVVSSCENENSSDLDSSKRIGLDESSNCDQIFENVSC